MCIKFTMDIYNMQERCEMMQSGDKSILLNVAKVISMLVVVMFVLMAVASYVGGGL